jgi:undecaprenyl-diphosphatase
MAIIILIFLGIIQGLTEFLPVSSSGHLALLESIFRFNQSQRLSYTAFLHLGTVLALLFYFRKRIFEILADLFISKDLLHKKESLSLIFKIIIGTIPAVIVGYFLKDKIDTAFIEPIYSAVFLIITGIILFTTKFSRETKNKVSYSDAILIGCAQAVALLPGISRSGATISIALLLGLSRADGFEFSFLLSIPAVLGANLLMLKDLPPNLSISFLILAIVIPFAVGLVALKLLRNIILKKQFHNFAYYCWVIGILATVIIIFN